MKEYMSSGWEIFLVLLRRKLVDIKVWQWDFVMIQLFNIIMQGQHL